MYTGSGIYVPNEGPVDVGRILELVHTPAGDGALVMMAHQAGKGDALKKIREGAPDAVIQIRRYVEDWTTEKPADCAARFIETMDAFAGYTDHGTWANEQDLAAESKGKVGAAMGRLMTWDEWRAIAAYNYVVASIIRRDAPWIVLHYPGSAYGHGEDWGYDRDHNVMPGFPTYADGEPDVAYNLLRPGIDLCHILNVHPYVQRGAPIMDGWSGLGRLKLVKDLFPNKTLFAAETGDFDVWNPQAPQRILDIAYHLQGDPQFLGYCFFILDSPDPAHAMNNWSNNRAIEAAYQTMTRIERPRVWSLPGPTPPIPEPEPVMKMPTGRAWWVWYIENCGGVQGIIDACKRTNVKNVFIKGGDGPYVWNQLTSDVVDALNVAGIEVYVWHYAYLGWIANNVHGDTLHWTVADEIECVRAMVEQAGPNVAGFISDPEAETEGRPNQAEDYANSIRVMLDGKFFGYAPLPVIDYHQELPYVQFNRHTDAVMPQFYSLNLDGNPPWTYARLIEQWDRWMVTWQNAGHRVPVLMPAGEAYGSATDDGIREFELLVKTMEWPSHSYWSLEHAINEGHMPAIEAVAAIEQTDREDDMTIDLNPADEAELQTIFGDMWAKAERVNAILSAYSFTGAGARIGYWTEQGLKAAVSQAKEPLGLND